MTITSNEITITVTAPPAVASTISLFPSSTSVETGVTDTLTAIVHDQYGNPMSGVSVSFLDLTTNTTVGTATTDSSGSAVLPVSFTSTGTYNMEAQAA